MGQIGITADPKVMVGKPTIAGTRITVEPILEKLAAGETVEQIVDMQIVEREFYWFASLVSARTSRLPWLRLHSNSTPKN